MALLGTNTYIRAFTTLDPIVIRGTDHGFPRACLRIEVLMTTMIPGHMIPYPHWAIIDPVTCDITVQPLFICCNGLVRLTAQAT